MAKTASQRRLAKRGTNLTALGTKDPGAFNRIWDNYLRGWLCEVRARARAQHTGQGDERSLRIFDVLSQARLLAKQAGAFRQPHVVLSLITLQHECGKAVATVNDARLYSFNEDCTTRIRNLNVRNRGRD